MTLELGAERIDVAASTKGRDHAVVVAGLVAGGDYRWTASVQTEGGVVECPEQTLSVPGQVGIIQMVLNRSEPGSAVAKGFLVISTLQTDSAWAAVLDGQGRYRMVVGTDSPSLTIAHARLARDGRGILYNQFDADRVDDVGSVARLSFDGSVSRRTRTYMAHHDFVELPDETTFAWMAYDRRDALMDVPGAPLESEADQHCSAGRCPIAGEALYEGTEGSSDAGDAMEVVNWWDDWETAPWWVCDHMWRYDTFVPGYYEMFHVNSLAYVEHSNAYYALSRYTDALFKIGRDTGRIEWQLGGRDTEFELLSGEWFDHGHVTPLSLRVDRPIRPGDLVRGGTHATTIPQGAA